MFGSISFLPTISAEVTGVSYFTSSANPAQFATPVPDSWVRIHICSHYGKCCTSKKSNHLPKVRQHNYVYFAQGKFLHEAKNCLPIFTPKEHFKMSSNACRRGT